jgi:hypothetical protein
MRRRMLYTCSLHAPTHAASRDTLDASKRCAAIARGICELETRAAFKYADTHACRHVCMLTHTHARTHARARTHTHTHACDICLIQIGASLYKHLANFCSPCHCCEVQRLNFGGQPTHPPNHPPTHPHTHIHTTHTHIHQHTFALL